MHRAGNTSHPDLSATAGEGLWIERLQLRSASAPSKCAEERQDEGMWIERLQQRRFFPAEGRSGRVKGGRSEG
jgi:hypothetical protein